jgi:hypothetical protein
MPDGSIINSLQVAETKAPSQTLGESKEPLIRPLRSCQTTLLSCNRLKPTSIRCKKARPGTNLIPRILSKTLLSIRPIVKALAQPFKKAKLLRILNFT